MCRIEDVEYDDNLRIAWAIKRALDIALSAMALIVLSPLCLIIAVLIVIDSEWPPLFVQIRVGRNGRQFRLYKFRTMVVNADKIGAGLFFEQDDPRFTRVGRVLRRTTLDEIPQFWNVLCGDISLIGPRPMVPVLAAKLSPEQNRRHCVRPGMTGWAWLKGRNNLTWSERIELDNWYIGNWSLWLDLRILLMTIPKVLKGEDVRLDQSADEVDDLQATQVYRRDA